MKYMPNIFAGIQDAGGKYLFNPGRLGTIRAAGSKISYGRTNNKEYIYIPGPTTHDLKFMVRKYDLTRVRPFFSYMLHVTMPKMPVNSLEPYYGTQTATMERPK